MIGDKVGLRCWYDNLEAKVKIESVETGKIGFKDFGSRKRCQKTNQRGQISRYAKFGRKKCSCDSYDCSAGEEQYATPNFRLACKSLSDEA